MNEEGIKAKQFWDNRWPLVACSDERQASCLPMHASDQQLAKAIIS